MGRLVYARGPLEAFVAGCIYGPERSVCVTCQGIWYAHARRTISAASRSMLTSVFLLPSRSSSFASSSFVSLVVLCSATCHSSNDTMPTQVKFPGHDETQTQRDPAHQGPWNALLRR